jgi:tetratricopeptide (TPR) repeat protein
MIGSTWNTIGWVYVQRREFAKASEALAKAERLADEMNDHRLRGYVLQTRAELELARGHAKEALEIADASLGVKESSKRGRALSLLVKAQALAATDAPLPAVDRAFATAFDALKPFGRRQLARAYELHFEVLAKRQRFREAAQSAQRALELMRPALADT